MKNFFKPMETFVSLHLAIYGISLLHPSQTFTGSAYHSLSMLISEPIFGAICVALAVLLMISVWMDLKKFEVLLLTTITSLWSFIVAMFIVAFFVTGVLSTGMSYLAVGLFAGWLAWKVGGTI